MIGPRALLLGQAPSQTSDPAYHLFGLHASGLRLRTASGLSLARWLAAFDRRNVLDHWPGTSGTGDAFPMDLARPAARAILESRDPSSFVVCVGRAVFKACGGSDGVEPFSFVGIGDLLVTWVPHPSGRNRMWNALDTRMQTGEILRILADGALAHASRAEVVSAAREALRDARARSRALRATPDGP